MHIDFNQGQVYWYEDGKDFEHKDKFETSMDLHAISPEVMHCYNIKGKWSKKHQDEVVDELKRLGYKVVIGYFPTGWIPKHFKSWHDCHVLEL